MNQLNCESQWGQDDGSASIEGTSVTSITSDPPPSSEEWSQPVPLVYIPDPLPLDGLPPWFRNHVESVAAATQTPPDMALGFGLAALATAVNGPVRIQIEDGWIEPTNLYVCVVAPPGSGKSPAFGHMIRPIEAFERELVEEGQQDVRLFVQDITAEKLGQVMAANADRIAVLAPEGDFFGNLGGRYSEGAASLGLFKQGWSGESFRDDRVGREGSMLNEPLITVGIATQPHVMKRIRDRDAFVQEGLVGRFLWFCPEDLVGRRLTGLGKPNLDVAAAERYKSALTELLRRAHGKAGDGRIEVKTLVLSNGAAQAYDELARWAERMRCPGGLLREIREWSTKLEVQAFRVAALVEVALRVEKDDFSWNGEIRPEAMETASRMARSLISHAQTALDRVRPDRVLEDAKTLLEKLLEYSGEGEPTLQWLQRHGGREHLRGSNAAVRKAVALLEQRGYLRLVEQPSQGGRPPSPIIRVNPLARRDRSDRSLSGDAS